MLFSIQTLKKIIYLLIMGSVGAGFWSIAPPEGQAQEAISAPVLVETEAHNEVDAFENGNKERLGLSTLVQTSTITATAPALIDPDLNDEIVEFTELGVAEDSLRGPYQTESFKFRLPATWELTPGAELTLDLVTFLGGVGNDEGAAADTSVLRGGSLEVFFNDIVLSKIVLDQVGERSITLSIPETALISPRADGRHELKIDLDSALNCDFDNQPTVTVRPTSRFVFPHQIIAPTTDLRLLPRPIYQDSFIPDTAVMVVPNKPTTAELQAALAVAAGFGRMSYGRLALSLLPVDQLTPEVQENNHLIFVGKPKAFSILNEISLPAPLNGAGFEAAELDESDGVIQMAVSPWNPSKVVLVVGGASDEAVNKAGLAVSSGVVMVGEQSNLAFVAEIRAMDEIIPADQSIIDRTFADLGYSTETRKGRDVDWIEYRFDVPPGHVADVGAYVELAYNHSAFLDYEQSGLVVYLNDELIGNMSFSDKSTTRVNTVQFTIPRYALHTGSNNLTIRAELMPVTDCVNPDLEGLWVTIWPDSSLYIPLIPLRGDADYIFDLDNYPEPFILDASLDSTAFILSPDDPTAWDIAAQIALDLGNRATTPLAELVVVTDPTLPEQIRENRHLLIIGQPRMLPLIAELGEALPIPFEVGGNLTSERAMRVIYRFPAETSLGYIEALPAPWDRGQTVIAVLGTDAEGLRWAGAILTEPRLRHNLDGDFLIIRGDQIVVSSQQQQPDPALLASVSDSAEPAAQTPASSSQTSAVAEPQAEPLPVAETVVASDSSLMPAARRPIWLVPLLGLSTTLMVAIVGVVVFLSWRQHRPNA